MTPPAKIVLHLNQAGLRNLSHAPYLALHARIRALVGDRGGHVETRLAPPAMRLFDPVDLSDLLEPEALHIIENGTVQQPNVLNTSLSYLNGYFQLDPMGIHAFSSTVGRVFEPDNIDLSAANQLLRDLVARHVTPRASRYAQTADFTRLPQDAIAVFLQGAIPERQGSAHCDEATMLRAVVAQAGGRPVVVKSHPRANSLPTTEVVFEMLSQGQDLIPTEANVHDILAQCAVAVSFNSAVMIEGYMHATPAILFGRSDLHHIAQTVRKPNEFGAALAAALTARPDYARYLWWFLMEQSLPMGVTDIDDRILARFATSGFDGDRLGLVAPDRGRRAAAHLLDRLRAKPGLDRIRILATESVTQTRARHSVRLDRSRRTVHQEMGAGAEQAITLMQQELDLVTQHLGAGPHQVNRCLAAWPNDGLALLTVPTGPRLSDKIARVAGLRQRALFDHAGRWLAAYTAPRRREATFAPVYWVQQMARRDLFHIRDATDRGLMDDLLDHLRAQVPRLRGTPVLQAATHGDFSSDVLHYQRGVMTGTGIYGPTWLAISKDAAHFLVHAQSCDAPDPQTRICGINADIWRPFLASGVVAACEMATTLPFFVGEQIWSTLADPDTTGQTAAQLRAAARSYVETVP